MPLTPPLLPSPHDASQLEFLQYRLAASFEATGPFFVSLSTKPSAISIMTVTFESGSIKAWQTCRSPEQPFFGTTIAANVGWTPCFFSGHLDLRAKTSVHKIAGAFSTAGVFSAGMGGAHGASPLVFVHAGVGKFMSPTIATHSTIELQPRAFSGTCNVTVCSRGERVLERQAVPNSRSNNLSCSPQCLRLEFQACSPASAVARLQPALASRLGSAFRRSAPFRPLALACSWEDFSVSPKLAQPRSVWRTDRSSLVDCLGACF